MAAAKGVSVVLVDDNGSMRAVLRAILNAEGYSVVGEASDGASALTLIGRLKPRVVALDLVMPGRSGLEVLPEIFQISPDSHVLVVSGSDDQASVKKAFDLGAVGFVSKPFNPDKILRVFEQLFSLHKPRPSSPAGTVGAAGAQKRCVIVDDNRSMRSLLKAMLEEGGISVIAVAADGMSGLAAIERDLPDFVCLDVDMPELDGLNVLTCLRAVHPFLPVIMVTSHADRETISQTLQLRVSAYLLKPFDQQKVMAAVRKTGVLP